MPFRITYDVYTYYTLFGIKKGKANIRKINQSEPESNENFSFCGAISRPSDLFPLF